MHGCCLFWLHKLLSSIYLTEYNGDNKITSYSYVMQKHFCETPLLPPQLLWKQAQSFPLFPALGEMESHMFECVNQAAVHEELEDETRRLCDVRPFLPVLKLVTRNCGRAERLLDSKIGVLIGKGKTASLLRLPLKLKLSCKLLHTLLPPD